MNCQLFNELHKGEIGERFNLKRTYKWILNEMDYEDFKVFAKLQFVNTNPPYPFEYSYRISKEADSSKAREEFIKYLMYKLIQNLDTEGVKLWGSAE